MIMKCFSGLVLSFLTACASTTPRATLGQAPARTPVVTTPHFAFYSDFDTNLNDALIAVGVARKFRDSAERADTPRGFGIGHLRGD